MSRKEVICVAAISGAVAGAVGGISTKITEGLLERILPAVPSADTMMFILYITIMSLVSIVFGIAIVYMLWRALKSVWSLKNRERRRNVWEKVRMQVQQWPTGKMDVLAAMATTWFIAVCVPIVVLIFTVSEGQLEGQIPLETPLITLVLAIAPMYALFLWHFYEFLKRLRQKWITETRNGRIQLATIVIVAIFVFGLMMWGDYAGWDDRIRATGS